MKLSNIQAQRLLIGLKQIDADETTKLDAEVRLKIAVNINRMTPDVIAYQRTAEKLEREKNAERARVDGVQANGVASIVVLALGRIEDQIIAIQDTVEDWKLKRLDVSELKLKDNPKIKADLLAMIAPVIKGFDDKQSDEGDD